MILEITKKKKKQMFPRMQHQSKREASQHVEVFEFLDKTGEKMHQRS